jgi:hypothetical protein
MAGAVIVDRRESWRLPVSVGGRDTLTQNPRRLDSSGLWVVPLQNPNKSAAPSSIGEEWLQWMSRGRGRGRAHSGGVSGI